MGASLGSPDRGNDKIYHVIYKDVEPLQALKTYTKSVTVTASIVYKDKELKVQLGPRPLNSTLSELNGSLGPEGLIFITKIDVTETRGPSECNLTLEIIIPTKSFYLKYESELKGTTDNTSDGEREDDVCAEDEDGGGKGKDSSGKKTRNKENDVAKSEGTGDRAEEEKERIERKRNNVPLHEKYGDYPPWIKNLLQKPPETLSFKINFTPDASFGVGGNVKTVYLHSHKKVSRHRAGFSPEVLDPCQIMEENNSVMVVDKDWEIHGNESNMYKFAMVYCANSKNKGPEKSNDNRNKNNDANDNGSETKDVGLGKGAFGASSSVAAKSVTSSGVLGEPGEKNTPYLDYANVIKPVREFKDDEWENMTRSQKDQVNKIKYISKPVCDEIRGRILKEATEFFYIDPESSRVKASINSDNQEYFKTMVSQQRAITFVATLNFEYHVISVK